MYHFSSTGPLTFVQSKSRNKKNHFLTIWVQKEYTYSPIRLLEKSWHIVRLFAHKDKVFVFRAINFRDWYSFILFFFKRSSAQSSKQEKVKEQTLNNEPVKGISAKFFHCMLEGCWNLKLPLFSMQRSNSSGLLTMQRPQDNISGTVSVKSCNHNKCVQFLFFFKGWKTTNLDY